MNKNTSLYLDIIRPIAAIIVFLSHISELTDGGLSFFSPYGVQAVDIFFVLSGFVIAHVCATRETDWQSYFTSRAVRIYSVAIPAIIITFMLDGFGMRMNADLYVNHYQGFTLGPVIRSFLFINEQWNVHRFPGSNSPYWSLGFEVWYYIIFGAFLFSPPRWRVPTMIALMLFIGPKVLLMLPTWILGVVSYRIATKVTFSRFNAWVLLIAPLPLVILFERVHAFDYSQPFMALVFTNERLLSVTQDYILSLLFASHLIGFASLSDHFGNFLSKYKVPIRWIAGSTFSIYLFHMPVLHFLAAASPFPIGAPGTMAILLTATLPICFLFAEVSERRKEAWRWLIASVMKITVKYSPP